MKTELVDINQTRRNLTVEIPPATPAAGSINISCLGTSLGTVGISLAIGGLVSVQTATYDVNSGVLSLDDASVLLDGVEDAAVGRPV